MSDQELADRITRSRERNRQITAYSLLSTARIAAFHEKQILLNSQVGMSDRVKLADEQIDEFAKVLKNV